MVDSVCKIFAKGLQTTSDHLTLAEQNGSSERIFALITLLLSHKQLRSIVKFNMKTHLTVIDFEKTLDRLKYTVELLERIINTNLNNCSRIAITNSYTNIGCSRINNTNTNSYSK